MNLSRFHDGNCIQRLINIACQGDTWVQCKLNAIIINNFFLSKSSGLCAFARKLQLSISKLIKTVLLLATSDVRHKHN